MQSAKISVIVPIYNVENSNFAHEIWLCTLKIQYLAVIWLSKLGIALLEVSISTMLE